MKEVIKNHTAPAGSIILNGYKQINYCDTFRVRLANNESVDKITTKVFRVPDWGILLMRIRDSIAGLFGLKTGDKEDLKEAACYPVGSKAVYFTVIDRTENEIVMSENDKHLEFRTSVMITKNGDESFADLTTVVKYHNIWGRIYFFFVKPFHQMLMRSLMKRL
jgi:hypothetical protein